MDVPRTPPGPAFTGRYLVLCRETGRDGPAEGIARQSRPDDGDELGFPARRVRCGEPWGRRWSLSGDARCDGDVRAARTARSVDERTRRRRDHRGRAGTLLLRLSRSPAQRLRAAQASASTPRVRDAGVRCRRFGVRADRDLPPAHGARDDRRIGGDLGTDQHRG